jgi:ribosomal protein S18 acetylase RimI-like enzyme
MSTIEVGTDVAVAACVDLWIRALTARDGVVPVEGVVPRTRGKFDHPALRFALIGAQEKPDGFALTTRLSEASAEAGERDGADAHKTAYLELLAIEPTAAGAGLGRALVLDAIESAVAVDCREVMLHVRIDNVKAIRLYESEGFTFRGKPQEHELAGALMIEMRREIAP